MTALDHLSLAGTQTQRGAGRTAPRSGRIQNSLRGLIIHFPCSPPSLLFPLCSCNSGLPPRTLTRRNDRPSGLLHYFTFGLHQQTSHASAAASWSPPLCQHTAQPAPAALGLQRKRCRQRPVVSGQRRLHDDLLQLLRERRQAAAAAGERQQPPGSGQEAGSQPLGPHCWRQACCSGACH